MSVRRTSDRIFPVPFLNSLGLSDANPSTFTNIVEIAVTRKRRRPEKPKRRRKIFSERGGKVVGVECCEHEKQKEGNITLVTEKFAKAKKLARDVDESLLARGGRIRRVSVDLGWRDKDETSARLEALSAGPEWNESHEASYLLSHHHLL